MSEDDDDNPAEGWAERDLLADYDRVPLVALEVARKHLAEMQAEGIDVGSGTKLQHLIEREAARILRNAADEIDPGRGPWADAP